MRGRLGPQINVFAIQGMCNAVNIDVAREEEKLIPGGSSLCGAGSTETHETAGVARVAPPGDAEIHIWTCPGTSLGKPAATQPSAEEDEAQLGLIPAL